MNRIFLVIVLFASTLQLTAMQTDKPNCADIKAKEDPRCAPTTVAEVRSQLPAVAQQTTTILDTVSTAAATAQANPTASNLKNLQTQQAALDAKIQAIIDAKVAKMSPEDQAAYKEGKKDF